MMNMSSNMQTGLLYYIRIRRRNDDDERLTWKSEVKEFRVSLYAVEKS